MPHNQPRQIAVIEIESKRLRERAINCHRLAVGVGDPKFAIKLEAIAGEYEARAAQADARTALPKK
jgi:hypothetical protein